MNPWATIGVLSERENGIVGRGDVTILPTKKAREPMVRGLCTRPSDLSSDIPLFVIATIRAFRQFGSRPSGKLKLQRLFVN